MPQTQFELLHVAFDLRAYVDRIKQSLTPSLVDNNYFTTMPCTSQYGFSFTWFFLVWDFLLHVLASTGNCCLWRFPTIVLAYCITNARPKGRTPCPGTLTQLLQPLFSMETKSIQPDHWQSLPLCRSIQYPPSSLTMSDFASTKSIRQWGWAVPWSEFIFNWGL